MESANIYDKVQEHYGTIASGGDVDNGEAVAREFGYSREELDSVDKDANLGLSCGNPLALANVKEGETVLDLGSGAGFDVFLASGKVGSTGKVIGVDQNKDMLKRANGIKEKTGSKNVSFIESPITKIAVPDSTVDCIISNCVVNLVPEADKHLVFEEMHRVLRPGGRVAVSDVLAKGELPQDIKSNMALYVGCIAGASLVKDYEKYLGDAGFSDILIVDSKSDLNVYNADSKGFCCVDLSASATQSSSCCGSEKVSNGCGPKPADKSVNGIDFNEYAGSFKIYALKS